MTNPVHDRIDVLRVKKDRLTARIAKLQATAKSVEQRREMRRKIIVGEAVLAALADNPVLAMSLRSALSAYVEKPADRDAVADLLGTAAALPRSG